MESAIRINEMPDNGNLLSVKQVAEYLNVGGYVIYSWVAKRLIPYVRIGHRTIRFRREEIDAWIRNKSVSNF